MAFCRNRASSANMPCMLLHDKFEDIDEWQDYVNLIMDSGLIEACAVYNRHKRALAQSDEEFEIAEMEIWNICQAFIDPNNPKHKSLELAGQHYTVCLNDGNHGMLLKGGVRYATVCKTFNVLIIGLHKVNTKTDDASAVVMNLGDYLFTKGM